MPVAQSTQDDWLDEAEATRHLIRLEHMAERRFLQRDKQRIEHRIEELTRILGDDGAHPASQDRAGGPNGPEPATQSQPEALIPCAECDGSGWIEFLVPFDGDCEAWSRKPCECRQ